MIMAIRKPQDFPWWNMRLTFLMDNHPQRLWEWFQKDKPGLMEHLDQMTLKAVHGNNRNLKEGMDEMDSEEILQNLLCPPEEVDLDADQLTTEQREIIWQWAEELPDEREVQMEF
jgi:hypothetical protein